LVVWNPPLDASVSIALVSCNLSHRVKKGPGPCPG
jgi:hypothetical protein